MQQLAKVNFSVNMDSSEPTKTNVVARNAGYFLAGCLGLLLAGLSALTRLPVVQTVEGDDVWLTAASSLTDLDHNFRLQVEACLLPVARLYDFDLRITSAFRSWSEQDELYRLGRYEDGHIVTEVPGGFSSHNYGLAVDVVDRLHGYRLDWQRLGRIGAYCGLEQGEDGDEAHFQHRAGLSIWQLMEGRRPPSLLLPCVTMAERLAAEEAFTAEDLATCPPIAFAVAKQEM